MDLAERIKSWREAAGLTMQELADRVGVTSTSTVWSWEHGKTAPRQANLLAMCDVFGISIAQFYGDTPGAQ